METQFESQFETTVDSTMLETPTKMRKERKDKGEKRGAYKTEGRKERSDKGVTRTPYGPRTPKTTTTPTFEA